MTLLGMIYGLWQQYDYEYLLYKTIQIFIIWMIGTYVLQIILRMIIPKPEPEESELPGGAEIPEPAEAGESSSAKAKQS